MVTEPMWHLGLDLNFYGSKFTRLVKKKLYKQSRGSEVFETGSRLLLLTWDGLNEKQLVPVR